MISIWWWVIYLKKQYSFLLNNIFFKSWYDRIGTLPYVKFWKTSPCGRRDVNYEFIFNSLEDRNYQILITLDFMQMVRS